MKTLVGLPGFAPVHQTGLRQEWRLRTAALMFRPMETPAEIRDRWRYLRDLLIQQLERFEAGGLTLHSGEVDVSADAIAKLKRNIQDFDEVIAQSEARDRWSPPPRG
jgi:hypothetical protein